MTTETPLPENLRVRQPRKYWIIEMFIRGDWIQVAGGYESEEEARSDAVHWYVIPEFRDELK